MINAPHVARMLVEAEELGERCAKLDTFLEGEVFPTLQPTDQTLLNAQLGAMGTYLSILMLRIDRARGVTQPTTIGVH